MITGTLKNGFKFEYDETRLDDMRFVDLLGTVVDEEAEDFEQITAVSKLMTLMLGKELKAQLYDHIAKENDGRVPVEAFKDCLEELMKAAGEKTQKN